MGAFRVQRAAELRGTARVPGDKSLSHRAVLLGALGAGTTQVHGFLPATDCLATVACMRALGIEVTMESPESLLVHGRGLRGWTAPQAPLECGGSGTTIRLLAGALAGCAFESTLVGNAQLSRRPMGRVAVPLRALGARVTLAADDRPPITVQGGNLRGITYTLPVPSAQVKSAVLLAGLFAEGPTTVIESAPLRDHTERLLTRMGAALTSNGRYITLTPPAGDLPALGQLRVPGDFSSAAFLLVAATLVPGATLTLVGVNLNPTRTGLLEVLDAMGADWGWVNRERYPLEDYGGEPVADLVVRGASLIGRRIEGAVVPRMIDEFPILAVAATQADGFTEVHDAGELRVKETDRIATLVSELRKLGARIEPLEDGFVVEGPTRLRGATVTSHGDHRLAMALAVAGLVAEGETCIEDADCVADSFPGFATVLAEVGAPLVAA